VQAKDSHKDHVTGQQFAAQTNNTQGPHDGSKEGAYDGSAVGAIINFTEWFHDKPTIGGSKIGAVEQFRRSI